MARTELHGVRAVAAHLGVSTRTAFRYARGADPLPLRDFRGHWRTTTRELDAWVKRQTRRKTASGAAR